MVAIAADTVLCFSMKRRNKEENKKQLKNGQFYSGVEDENIKNTRKWVANISCESNVIYKNTAQKDAIRPPHGKAGCGARRSGILMCIYSV